KPASQQATESERARIAARGRGEEVQQTMGRRPPAKTTGVRREESLRALDIDRGDGRTRTGGREGGRDRDGESSAADSQCAEGVGAVAVGGTTVALAGAVIGVA